ncbi:MAG: UvrB/UvrC motif-containing protein, partial [Clostridia bacterium]|nr:UvrB/UvrC motif-containing protein [Clostridia bacterium]
LNAAMPSFALESGRREPRGEKRCPVCGSTLADITRNGRLGCGECYSVFGGMPLPKPKAAPDEAEPPKNEAPSREELEAQMKEAVAAENFEEAARIRDILRGKKNA